jgi:hypothetical protein
MNLLNTLAAAIGLGNYNKSNNGSRRSSRNLPLRDGRVSGCITSTLNKTVTDVDTSLVKMHSRAHLHHPENRRLRQMNIAQDARQQELGDR